MSIEDSMNGVTFCNTKLNWVARVRIDGVQLTIGRFQTEAEACQAVESRKRSLEMTESVRIKTVFFPVPTNWRDFTYHPYACVVEFGAGINLDGLAAHMRRHGYDETEPIVLFRESPKHDPRILAGRHRHQAAIMAEATPSFRILEGNDEMVRAFALKDILRRHLSESQRAMIAATLANLGEGRPSGLTVGYPTVSQGEAADSLGVSRELVNLATRVLTEGTEEVSQAVRDGTLKVSDAASIVSATPEVQNQAVQDVKEGKSRTAKAAAEKKLLCERCQRVGPQVDCQGCKNMRTEAEVKKKASARKKAEVKKKASEKKVLHDKVGNVVPDRCRDAFADPCLSQMIDEVNNAEAMVSADAWIKLAGKLTAHYGFILIEKFDEHVHAALESLQLAAEALRSGLPYAVCPSCHGEDLGDNGHCCKACRGHGHIPQHRYEELAGAKS